MSRTCHISHVNAPCALGSIRQRAAQESAPPAMPTALDDPAFLARLRAEAHATAKRIAEATRMRAVKAAEERRVSESGERMVKEKS